MGVGGAIGFVATDPRLKSETWGTLRWFPPHCGQLGLRETGPWYPTSREKRARYGAPGLCHGFENFDQNIIGRLRESCCLGFAQSFSAHVLFGERGAPVQGLSLAPGFRVGYCLASSVSRAFTRAGSSGVVLGAKRAVTLPPRSTTNFSKFQRSSGSLLVSIP
jgi:hypothetical protein